MKKKNAPKINKVEQNRWLGSAILEINKHHMIGEVKVKLLIWLTNNQESIPGNYRDISMQSGVGLVTVSKTVSHLVESGLMVKQQKYEKNYYELHNVEN